MIIRTDREWEGMREAGRLAAEVLRVTADAVEPGMTTLEIDAVCRKSMKDLGCTSASLGYHGYPGALCVSVNEEVIHGIPGHRVVNVGDVVSLDVCVRSEKGFYGDNCKTLMLGVTDPAVIELVEGTDRALAAGIAAVRPGAHLSDVSAAVEKVAREHRLGVVREFCGHGIGRTLHESPEVPNYGRSGRGLVLKEGMVFCIEPMLTRGSGRISILDDKWTVVTGDGLFAAHSEHMVAVVHGGVEVLTPR